MGANLDIERLKDKGHRFKFMRYLSKIKPLAVCHLVGTVRFEKGPSNAASSCRSLTPVGKTELNNRLWYAWNQRCHPFDKWMVATNSRFLNWLCQQLVMLVTMYAYLGQNAVLYQSSFLTKLKRQTSSSHHPSPSQPDEVAWQMVMVTKNNVIIATLSTQVFCYASFQSNRKRTNWNLTSVQSAAVRISRLKPAKIFLSIADLMLGQKKDWLTVKWWAVSDGRRIWCRIW